MYTEDTIDIRLHKETRNSCKHDLQAPLSTARIRDKNRNSVPTNIHQNLWLKAIYIVCNFNTVQTKCYNIMYQF